MPQIAFVSDTCLVGTGRPIVAFLEHWAAGRSNEDWIRSCLRRAHDEYARGTDPAAVAAGLLGLVGEPDVAAACGVEWLTAAARRHCGSRLREQLVRHRRRGDELVVLTELPQPRPAAGIVGGAPVAIVGSRLPSGRVDAMVGERRVAAITDHVAPGRCTAYGMTPTDLPMLRAVGVPVVVGAHPSMLRAAAEQGWRCADHGPPPALRARRVVPRRPRVPGSADETRASGSS